MLSVGNACRKPCVLVPSFLTQKGQHSGSRRLQCPSPIAGTCFSLGRSSVSLFLPEAHGLKSLHLSRSLPQHSVTQVVSLAHLFHVADTGLLLPGQRQRRCVSEGVGAHCSGKQGWAKEAYSMGQDHSIRSPVHKTEDFFQSGSGVTAAYAPNSCSREPFGLLGG